MPSAVTDHVIRFMDGFTGDQKDQLETLLKDVLGLGPNDQLDYVSGEAHRAMFMVAEAVEDYFKNEDKALVTLNGQGVESAI